MTDTKEDIRKALAAATPGNWDVRGGVIVDSTGAVVANPPRMGERMARGQIADAHLIANAPQWLAGLLGESATLKAERDRYERALHLIAPDGLPLQLTLGEPADGMPMFGRVSLVSPYLVATKPEGPDASFAGAREVYQYTYDEDTQHEAEHCTVGYFVTEDWLCERDEGAEEKYDEALARAEAAERERGEWIAAAQSHPAKFGPSWGLTKPGELRDAIAKAVDVIGYAVPELKKVDEERASLLAENARLLAECEALAAERDDADRFQTVTSAKLDEALARAEAAETKHASCEAHLRLVTEERERFAEQREGWRARSIANEERAEQAEKERDEALSGEADAVRRAESAELGCEIAYRREPTQAEGDAHEAGHRCDCCDDDCQRCAHLSPQGIKSGECFVAMGGWTGRRCRVCRRWVWGGPTACVACVATKERDPLLAENARLQGEIAQHIAFRAEVNDALPRPFGVTVIGAIKALRDELDARPAITEDDIDAIREGIYGDDRMSRKTLEAALAALSRVAHASQPKGDGGSDV